MKLNGNNSDGAAGAGRANSYRGFYHHHHHHHHHHHDYYHRCHLSDGLRDVVAGDGLAGGVGEGELPARKQLWDRQLKHSGLGSPHICQFWHTNALLRPVLSTSKNA